MADEPPPTPETAWNPATPPGGWAAAYPTTPEARPPTPPGNRTPVTGTHIGVKRDLAERSVLRRRESEESSYSCAYEVDIDRLSEVDITKLRLPELPPHVREAFRCAV